jgi:uncharacterized protein involved in outer membrane biogenesis
MIRWLLGLLLACVLLVLGGVTATLVFEPRLDLTAYRGPIAERLGALTGRRVHLDGEIRLDLGRHARVTLGDVAIANPAWAEASHLLSASRLAAGLDLFALLRGVVHLEAIVLHDASIALEVADDGERSWDLADPGRPASTSSPRLVIEGAALQDVSLLYRAAGVESPVRARLDRFSQVNDDGTLVIDGTGQVNAAPVRLGGRIGPLRALLAGRDIAVDLHAMLGEALLTLQGQLGEPARLEDIVLDASIQGPGCAGLFEIYGVRCEPTDETDLKVQVSDRDPGFAWQTTGRLGSMALDTRGEVGRPLEMNDLRMAVDVRGDDLTLLGRLLGLGSLPARGYSLTGGIRRDAQGLQLEAIELRSEDAQLTLSGGLPVYPRLDGADARLSLLLPDPRPFVELLGTTAFGTDLAALGALRGDVTLAAHVDGGALLDADVRLGDNQLTAHGPVGSPPRYAGSRLEFSVSGPDLTALHAPFAELWPLGTAFELGGGLRIEADGELRLHAVDGTAGGLGVSLDGAMGRWPGLGPADLSVRARGNSLRQFAGPRLPALPFRVETHLRGPWRAPAIDSLAVRVGQTQLTVTGRIGVPPDFDRSDARISATVADLVELLPQAAGSRWAQGEYRLSGRLRSDDAVLRLDELQVDGAGQRLTIAAAKVRVIDDAYRVDDLDARLNDGRITGTVAIRPGPRPVVDLDLMLRRLDLAPFLPEATPHDASDGAEVTGDGRLIPDRPLDLSFLDTLDGRFRIRGEELSHPDPVFPGEAIARRLELEATLGGGHLQLARLALGGDRGELTLRGDLRKSAQGIETDLVVQARAMRFGALAHPERIRHLPAHDLDAEFSARGRNPRELAATLNGRLRLSGGPGETRHIGLEHLFGSIAEKLVSELNPYIEKEKVTRVECTATGLAAVDGVVTLVPGFVARTDKVDIAATGTVDLTTERLAVQFRSAPRKGIGVSAAGLVRPYVKLGGTLSQPTLVLDPPAALLSGGVAVATSGLSIVAVHLLERLSTTGDPCARVLADESEAPSSSGFAPIESLRRVLSGQSKGQRDGAERNGSTSVLDQER